MIFRAAWTWAGKGKPVVEDLEKSREIAIAGMRQQTVDDTKAFAEASFFNDDTTTSADDVKAVYFSAEEQVKACTDVYAIKLLYCTFMGWDEPELPRGKKLKAKAEEAAEKLRAAIDELKASIQYRMAD